MSGCVIGDGAMQVGRWDGSLAVRLPDQVVEALGLKEGDEVELRAAGGREVEVARAVTREEALKRLASLAWPLPPGYRFNREELYERGGGSAFSETIPLK
jgi:antitoxin MazE